MKLISWNVNGIRAVLTKGFNDFIAQEKPDIICLQETKAHPSQVDKILIDYPHHFWHSAQKPGYSGTAVFSKTEPIRVIYGDGPMHDDEGRVLVCEFEKFYLVTVYTPNSQRGLTRLSFRRDWDKRFLQYLKLLEKQKPVIFCGDLNVAHTEIDLARPRDNIHNAGFTTEERKGFSAIIDAGFIDTFREFHKEGGQYTWWSYMFNARAKNIGWRIDYWCISRSLRRFLEDAIIYKDTIGSDHCPVGLVIKEI